MIKKVLVIIFIFLLTGCYNYQELNDYAIVTGMAIDYIDNQYEVSFLIANGNKKEDTDAETSLLTGKGNSIYTAIKDISLESPKELYISHLSVVILSEDYAKEGIQNLLDFLMRDPQSHQNFYMTIAKNSSAKDTLSILSPLSDYSSQNITSNIQNSEKLQGKITDSSFLNFMDKLLLEGTEPVLNSIVIEGNIKEGQSESNIESSKQLAVIKMDSIGLFHKDKLVGWATEEESIGIGLILGNVETAFFYIPYSDGYIIVTTNDYKVKKNVQKDKISILGEGKGIISEVNCNIDLNNTRELKNIEYEVEKVMKEYIYDAIKLSKKYEVDIFGFGSEYRKKKNKLYKRINNWNSYYKNIPVDIDVKFTFDNKGAIKNRLEDFYE